MTDQDVLDEQFREKAESSLRVALGSDYRRMISQIPLVFSHAPGGIDISNESSLYARLLGGRMSDGTLIGNDLDMVRWLISLSPIRNWDIEVPNEKELLARLINGRMTDGAVIGTDPDFAIWLARINR